MVLTVLHQGTEALAPLSGPGLAGCPRSMVVTPGPSCLLIDQWSGLHGHCSSPSWSAVCEVGSVGRRTCREWGRKRGSAYLGFQQ